MAHLLFTITGQSLIRLDSFKPVEKSYNYLRARFEILSEDWSGKTATAVFSKDSVTKYAVLDENGECLVPWEVLTSEGKMKVSVFCGERITTNSVDIYIYRSGYQEGSEELDLPTPSVYDDMQDYFANVRNQVVEDRDWIEDQVQNLKHMNGGTNESTDWTGEENENDEQNTTIQLRHGPTSALTEELVQKMLPGEAYVGYGPSSVTVKMDDGSHDELVTKTTYELLLEKVGRIEETLGSLDEELYDENSGAFKRLTNLESELSRTFNEANLSEDGLLTFLHDGTILVPNIGPFAGGGGGGGGGGTAYSKITIENRNEGEWSSIAVRDDESPVYKAYITSLDTETEEPTGDLQYVLYRGIDPVERGSMKQGLHVFELKDYLKAGSNEFRLSVTDSNGSNRSRAFSVTVVSLSITGEFSNNIVQTGSFDVPVKVVGNGNKTLYLEVDGTVKETKAVPHSGRTTTFTVTGLTHGVHTIRIWADVVSSGLTAVSNTVYYEVPVADGTSDDDMIASSFNETELQQYSTLEIPYFVYNRDSYYSDVQIFVNGNLVSEPTVGRKIEKFTYRLYEQGEITVLIKSGNAEKEFNITVVDSGINVAAETNGLQLYLSSMSRTNAERNPGVWEYNNGERTITTQFSGFDFGENDGWHADGQGSPALRLLGKDRITIDFEPFATNIENTGFTFEIEFSTHSVLDTNAKVLSCYKNDNEPGMYLTANEFVFKSQMSTLKTNFKEAEHITLAVVVTKNTESDGRLIEMFINGEIAPTTQYLPNDNFVQSPNGGGDNSRPKIVIGSDDCGIDIYKIRVYKNALNFDAIKDNYIADCPDLDMMIHLYHHNDIRDISGNIVLDKLPDDLPYFIFYVPELEKVGYDNFGNRLPKTWDPIPDLPRYKGNKKTVRAKFHHPTVPRLSFTAEGVEADVQGTSSQNYARKNYKVKFKMGFDLTESGEHVSKLAMRDNSVPVSTFCFKADVASSEGANNILLVRKYEEYCSYFFRTPPQEAELLKPESERRDIRQGVDGFPMIVCWAEDENSPIHFLGKYNFNNDKSTTDVFGFAVGDVSVEVRNNTSGRTLFQDGVAMSWGTTLDEKKQIYSGPVPNPTSTVKAYTGDFEFRYPDSDDIDWDDEGLFDFCSDFEEMVDWVRSTDVATPFLSDVEKAKIGYTGNWMTSSQQAQVDAVTLPASRIAEIDNMTIDQLLSAERLAEIDAMTPEELLSTERLIEINEMTVEQLLTAQRIAEIDAMDIEDSDKEELKEAEAEAARQAIRESEAEAARAQLKSVTGAREALKAEELQAAKDALMAPWKAAFIAAREQKFVDEFENYFELDAMAVYYVFTEVFLLSDSRAKNAFWTRMGGSKWFSLPYDMDTAIGIDNQGAISYNPWLEDGEHVGTDGDIFTGQKSTLWVNFRKLFADKIAQVYIYLRSNNILTYDDIINTFEAHQGVYPIDIINEDASFKYFDPLLKPEPNDSSGKLIPTAMYLKMCLGMKKQHTKWWINERLPLLDSKYRVGSAASEFLQFRAYEKADITLTTYKTVYPQILIGSHDFYPDGSPVPVKVQAGETVTIPIDISNLSNTESRVYSATAIRSINLYSVKPDTVDVSMGVNLEEVKLGTDEPGYTNENIGSKQGDTVTVGNLTHLKVFDVSNCPNLAVGIDLSGCTAIETIKAEGSAVTGFSLPNGGQLKTMLLGNNISSLIIKNHKGLSYQGEGANDPERGTFRIGTWNKIQILDLENIYERGDAMSVPFVNLQQVHNIIPASAAMHLVGFEWNATSVAEINAWLDEVDTHEDVNENGGRIGGSTAHVECTIHVPSITGEEYAAIKANHPGVTIVYGSIAANVYFWNSDGTGYTGVLNENPYAVVNVEGAGNATFPSNAPVPTKESTPNYDYHFIGWSTRRNQTAIDENALNHIETDRNVYAVFATEVVAYSVSFMNENVTLQSDPAVPYGSTPVYTGSTPTNISGRQFIGWTVNDGTAIVTDLSTVTITGDTIFHAVFQATYTVRLRNGNRIIQEYNEVGHGETITYGGSTPKNAANSPFLGWSYNNGETIITDLSTFPITRNIDLYAQFEPVYTVTFKKYATDSTDLYVAYNVVKGQTANYSGPEVVGNYGEEFLRWEPSNLNVTEDRVCVAVFETTYTVRFFVGNELYTTVEHVKYGANVPLPAEPTAQNKKFTGWLPSPTNVTRDMDVYATFGDTYSVYFFANETDANPIYTVSGLDSGDTAVFEGSLPVGEYNAPFVRWDPEPTVSNSSLYVYAVYEDRYTVTYYNENRSRTYATVNGVAPHASVTYPNDAPTPTKNGYRFVGWDKSTTDVTSDIDCLAVFVKLNTVTFENNGSVIYSDPNVETGSHPVYTGETPVDETYGGNFLGWHQDSGTLLITDLSTITINSDTVFHAVFSTAYVVKFFADDNDTVPYEVVKGVAYNGTATPTKPNPTKAGYIFLGWDPEPVNVRGHISVYANWEQLYTVRYLVDGSVVQSSDSVRAGQAYPFTGTAPTKNGYRFTGWLPAEPTNVTGNVDCVAQFVQVHTVRFMVDGTATETKSVDHGASTTFAGTTPSKSGYDFDGWYVSGDANQSVVNPSGVTINSDTDFVAKFTQLHTVRFMVDGTAVQTSSVRHGEDATFTGTEPTKSGYTFDGWSPAPTNITANTDCVAQWVKASDFNENAYGITWDYSTNTATATRVGLSASFADPTPATAVDGTGSSPFDNIAPWKDMKVYNVVNGTLVEKSASGFSFTDNDTVVYIPEFYTKTIADTSGKTLTLAISPTAQAGYTKHPGSGRYIGRYHTSGSSSAVFSKSGASPLVNTSQTNFRTYSKNKGSGWYMLDYATWNALQWLYLIEYANFDSQTTLGKGWNTGSIGAMGGTDGALYHTIKATGAHNMYRWVEDPFSNVMDWVDGFLGSTASVYLGTDPDTYDGTTTALTQTSLVLPASGYIKSFGYDANFPWALIPDTANGDTESYVKDKVLSSSSANPAYVGGSYSDSAYYGLFYFSAINAASYTRGNLGSRLLYRPL